MSYFRNFGNVVSAQLFSKPNNLLLRPCNLPKVLCQSVDPSINHLHTVKALVQTISALKAYQQSADGQYKEQIQAELNYLQTCREQYKVSIRKYVESNGTLTAQAIANLYAVSGDLGLSKTWLENYVQNQISNKAQYMNRSNIEDILSNLDKSNENVSLLQKNLSSKESGQVDYVQRIGNQVNQFEYCQKSKSNHDLIRALQSGTAFPVYFGGKWVCLIWSRVMSYVVGQREYCLHEN